MRVYTHEELTRVDTSMQVRLRVDERRIARFVEMYLADAPLPPIAIYDTDTGFVLADGYHRAAAFRALRGRDGAPNVIEYTLREGSRVDALLYALSTNDSGSLPLTSADRVEGVLRAWREHRLRYPEVHEAAPGLVLSDDEKYAVARRLREDDALSFAGIANVLGLSDASTVHQWLKRGYAGRRQKPDKRRRIINTFERLVALIEKQPADEWASAMVAEYARSGRPVRDLRRYAEHLRSLANLVEARADEFEAPHRYSDPPD